ncbi:S-layer homology domain-containing protein [Paenibacillus sp. GCM10028914]|uniref:S-layer homology domain-containing protein n=1 Tax=Paenibacillus sp. GCM10028914 TaxID=3273416 RepID=UPI003607D194
MGKVTGFYKKLISTALGFSLMLSPFAGVSAADNKGEVHESQSLNDISGHWASKTLQKWKEEGYLKGDSSGNLNPDAPITRAELAAIINRSFQFETKASISYSDVKKSAWYYNDLSIAASQGYMKGYSNATFKPNGNVTRQEVAVILSSLLELKASDPASDFSDTVNSPAWSKGAIGAVSSAGLMKGSNGKFRPTAGASRAEAATVLDRALEQLKAKEVTNYDKAGTYGPASGTEKVSGSVHINAPDITLQNMIIEGDLVIGEGVGEGDVTLNGVTVKGRTTVKGGGKNSIHVVDSVLVTVIVNKKDGSIRIVTEGSSSVSQITLQSGAILEETGLTGEGFKDLLLSDLIPAGSTVSLAGQFETVDVTAASLNVNLASGSVGQLNVASNASGTNLNVGSAASILSLILNAAANVGGQGSIGSAQVNATGVSFSQRPSNLVLGDNITVNVGSTSSSSSSGSSSNSGGGSSVNPPQPVIDRIQLTNGQAALQFVNAVPALELSDLNVSATVGDAVYTLDGISFNNSLKLLTFEPIPLAEYYGEAFVLKVAPAEGTTKFTTTLTGSVELEGFEGTIMDVEEHPVEGMKIDFRRGLNNTTGSIAATVITGADGRYTVNLPAGVYTGQLTKTGFITTYVVGVSLSDSFNQNEDATAIKIPASDEIRIVLTWGENPRDEDSHLLGPTPNGRSFHTWYGDRETHYQGELYADLDHDDVDSYGPETTTIRKRVDGKYQFYVHNFSRNGYDGTETLRNSAAKVEIYSGSTGAPVKTYHIPRGDGNELYWYVFDMEVDGAELIFTDYNQLVEDEPQSDLPPSIEYYFTSYIEGNKLVDQSQELRVQSGYYNNTEDQVYLRFSVEGQEDPSLIEMKTSEGELIPFVTKSNTIEAVYGSTDNGFDLSGLDLQFDLKFKQAGYYTLKTEIMDVYSNEVIDTLSNTVNIQHDLEGVLLNEMGKLLPISTVSYITTVGDAVYLTDRNDPLLEDTNVIIEGLELSEPTNVTTSVYLEQDHGSIKLVNYNDGNEALIYTATVKLKRGSLTSESYPIEIIVPTLDHLLLNAITFADDLIANDSSLTSLISAREAALQVETGSKDDKITALNQLVALLIEYL